MSGKNNKTAYNNTYPKLAVQRVNQALYSYHSFCLVDSEVLRNRHFRVAANVSSYSCTAMIEETCIYKGERYSVHDNGEVLRHPHAGKNPRPNDNKWTFGRANNKTGYLEISTVRIHRIVATAFHGTAPTKEHVVDHIDTNKRNNRPENLRWVTRLENVLLNPITAKRIATVCGSVEAFLANPSSFRDKFPDPNYNWMSKVSIEEAQISLERMLAWAKNDKISSGGNLGDWVFKRNIKQHEAKTFTENEIPNIEEMIDNVFAKVEKETRVNRNDISSKSKKHNHDNARIYAAKLFSQIGLSNERIGNLIGRSPYQISTYLQSRHFTLREQTGNKSLPLPQIQLNKSIATKKSLTPNAVQHNWKISSEFPCCPMGYSNNPITAYSDNLKTDSVFCRNEIYTSSVLKSALSEDRQTLYIMTKFINKNATKGWALAKVTYENNIFIHTNIQSFFTIEGAEKQFCLIQGLEWTGGDSIDDYC